MHSGKNHQAYRRGVRRSLKKKLLWNHWWTKKKAIFSFLYRCFVLTYCSVMLLLYLNKRKEIYINKWVYTISANKKAENEKSSTLIKIINRVYQRFKCTYAVVKLKQINKQKKTAKMLISLFLLFKLYLSELKT